MSEDCLYLNVFTPLGAATSGAPKKVMFWIYGGAFLYGDAFAYMPSRMVTDYDVIVVTIHYRVNVFGFLSYGKGDGNYGLYDQLMALQWTKNNIRPFGGDPNDITIFGESAGSASVSFLSLSPYAKGLFTKGILQSGTATAGWALNRDPQSQFISLARETGCLPWFYLSWLRYADLL
ncbi:bile salt-activated lipase-like [Aplysia californica]|uniref:Carboxylic ester hydrolase n=1 Tax=Aplysia californica TaxID=6500 RepID=A0ABM1A392_APLCA|nr:bile salt-activated lipase-like [Aplysia californica]